MTAVLLTAGFPVLLMVFPLLLGMVERGLLTPADPTVEPAPEPAAR